MAIFYQALSKGAKKDPEISRMMKIALRNNKEEDLKAAQEAEANKKAEEERIEAEKEKELEKMRQVNRQKDVWGYRVYPEKYHLRAGIVFADSEDEARDIVQANYPEHVSMNVFRIETAHSLIEVGLYIEG